MIDSNAIFIALVFVLAGLVKGVIGLGLPTIAMGLLAVAMSPIQAAALLILPSLVTNIWQMLTGRALAHVLKRLWPMMLGVCIGTWLGLGLIDGSTAKHGTALLGVALAAYAITGLASFRLPPPGAWESILSPLVGATTGVVTAATGVFVIPAVPYLQALGLEKDDLVQALWLSFTVSTLALAVNIALAGAFQPSMASSTFSALAFSCVGMWIGQMLRLKISSTMFRRYFFGGLLFLAVYLFAKSFT